jgi:hypothetical protein
MAKKNQIYNEAENEVFETSDISETYEATKKQEMGLELNPDEKMSLKLITGERVLWTLAEAKKPHNKRLLSPKMQKMLEIGKSVNQLLKEADKQ